MFAKIKILAMRANRDEDLECVINGGSVTIDKVVVRIPATYRMDIVRKAQELEELIIRASQDETRERIDG